MTHHDISDLVDAGARARTQMEDPMDYLVTATPTGGLLDLPVDERDELMADERKIATALIAGGAITWMWRLPGTGTTLAIWNAESAEDLDAHLKTLPVYPYNDVEVTALAAHPAFPSSLHAASGAGSDEAR